MRQKSVLIAGSVAIDNITTPFGEAKGVLGGSATYAAMAASLFAPVRLLGVTGSDFPQKYLEKLRRRVDISGLKICEGKSFCWTGFYGDNMNEAETLSVCPERLQESSLQIPGHYKGSEYLFLANNDPEVQLDVLNKIEDHKVAVLDTMNIWIENKLSRLEEVLTKIDIMLINETEAKMLTCRQNLVSAAKKIMSMGPRIVIIKKGEYGVLMMSEEDMFAIPAYPMEDVKDPTGAGDSFAGGFLGFLASSQDGITQANLRKAVVNATVVASFAVQEFSTAGIEKVTSNEIANRLGDMRKMMEF